VSGCSLPAHRAPASTIRIVPSRFTQALIVVVLPCVITSGIKMANESARAEVMTLIMEASLVAENTRLLHHPIGRRAALLDQKGQ
jgi:hypothetical protein